MSKLHHQSCGQCPRCPIRRKTVETFSNHNIKTRTTSSVTEEDCLLSFSSALVTRIVSQVNSTDVNIYILYFVFTSRVKNTVFQN